MRRTIHILSATAILAALWLTASAPGAPGAAAVPAAAAERGSSFASQFFVTYKTDPSTGQTQLEILGSLVIWFLLLLSVVGIGLIGHVTMTNQRKSIIPEGMVEEVLRLLTAGKYREALQLTETDESFFSQVVHASLREASHGFSAVIRGLEQKSDELTTVRLRRIEFLNVLGQVSPMIGLFGTVYGMILAFQAIKAAGGNPDPVMLAGGIGTALTTTFWGLVVAIPALAGYAIVRNRIDELTTEATLRAEELLNQFRPKAPPRPGPEPRTAAPSPKVSP
jgi:biopolymer transport protein ExbB